MHRLTEARLNRMIESAETKLNSHNRYATFEDGHFQVYLTSWSTGAREVA